MIILSWSPRVLGLQVWIPEPSSSLMKNFKMSSVSGKLLNDDTYNGRPCDCHGGCLRYISELFKRLQNGVYSSIPFSPNKISFVCARPSARGHRKKSAGLGAVAHALIPALLADGWITWGQAGLELLPSGDLPVCASESAGLQVTFTLKSVHY